MSGLHRTFNVSNMNSSMDLNSSVISDLSSIVDQMNLSSSRENLLNITEEENSSDRYIEIIKKVVHHYIRHNLTLVCLEDTMKLINYCCNARFPTSKHSILALFRENALFTLHENYYVRCENCKTYEKIMKSDKNNFCDKCSASLIRTEVNFFVYFPIKNQIIDSIQKNWEAFINFDDGIGSGFISDVHNASYITSLSAINDPDRNLLSLMINTDGANKFHSNFLSVWRPIQLIQNYLPPNMRYLPKNIIVAGLFYGPNKPDCLEFFFPLVNEMKDLQKNGISIDHGDETFELEPIITHCSVDLPAKHMLKQFNGFNACTYCHHPGMSIKLKTKSNKKTSGIRYPIPIKDTVFVYPARSHENTLASMQRGNFNKSDDGVTGLSCLVSMPNFDIIESFGIDYMHCVLLGVMRKLFNFYFDPKYREQPFHINKVKQDLLDKHFLQIKPNREVTRLPRSLAQRANYKASEMRSILLYYFPICLTQAFSNKIFVDHFRLLSSAIYTFLKPKISENEVADAHQKLIKFVTDFQKYFGLSNMVMNIHLLTHIAESVRRLGPLWAQSTFAFERNNGRLLKFVNGTTDVLDQITSKYLISNTQKSKEMNEEDTFKGKPVLMHLTSEEFLCIETNESKKIESAKISVYSRLKKKALYTHLSCTKKSKPLIILFN